MATESVVMAVIRASRPSFRNPYDKLAIVIHAAFKSAGYSLIATGRAAFSDQPPTEGEEVGIEGWNEIEENYGFVYVKSAKGKKKKTALVKCLVVGDALAVDVVDLGEPRKEPFHLQIKEAYKNLKGLVEMVNQGVLEQLEPKWESSSSGGSSERSGRSAPAEPAVGAPEGNQPIPSPLVSPPVPSSGNSDLLPGPCAGLCPSRGADISRGMLVGPNDPRWFGSSEPARFPGGVLGVPQGAHFNPSGPPGVPGFEPNRFIRNPGGPRGGTHPDLEHFGDPDYI